MNKKSHLLFITHDLGQGGAERVLCNLLNNLDFSRYKVDLLVETGRNAVYWEKLPKMVSVIYVRDIFRMAKIYRKLCVLSYKKHCYPLFLFIRSFFIKYSRFNELGRYDGVISFLEGSPVFFHSFWLENNDAFHISWIHCDPMSSYSFAFPSLYELFYRRMDNIICVTEASKRSFLKIYDIPQDRLNVIYNPIDKENIIKDSSAFNVNKKKFTIGFVGRLFKRSDRLIRAARLFKDAGYDLEFWFLGDSGDTIQLPRELDVEDCCIFWGFQKNPYPYMKAMDIYISTSDAEACSMTIIEACCLGCAVVSTRTRGSLELLDDGKYGILTDFDDRSIFLALKSLVDNPSLLQYYQKQALDRSQTFDLGQPMSKITEIIEKLSGLKVDKD